MALRSAKVGPERSRKRRARRMNDDRDADEILADPSHPIWKAILALVAILGAAWGVQNGTI